MNRNHAEIIGIKSTINAPEKTFPAPSLRRNHLHIAFALIWLLLGGILWLKFGVLFLIGFPFYFFFVAILTGWLLTGLLYYGVFISYWRLSRLLILIFGAIVLIPFATYFHIRFVSKSAEWAFRDFVASVEKGEVPERYKVSDPEGLKCFAEDVSSNYRLGSDFFFGVYDWWIEFENGTEYYITTSYSDESIFSWEVNVYCPFGRN